MAKIVANENAPSEESVYSVPGAEFSLAQGGSYETDDRDVLVEAEAHPWLLVEYDVDERPSPAWRDDSLEASDDALTAENSEAFDPEAVKRDREAVLGREGEDYNATAIDAGLDQDEVHSTGGVATTFAADDADDFDTERDE